jgi:aminoglycoside/choline kinase family phosphotransferase
MIERQTIVALKEAFKSWSGTTAQSVIQLPASGSDRTYFRISGNRGTAIGACHTNPAEFEAFTYLTRLFHKSGLSVPELYHADANAGIYLLQDLGTDSLFDIIKNTPDRRNLKPKFEGVLDHLVRFQVDMAGKIDFSKCYPRSSFDRQSMLWDLNYFKYTFLKPAGIRFHEDILENDFNVLVKKLETVEAKFFMYRDFQSRNIMIMDGKPWFIDYQGGRRGPLQYDIASLLFQVRAELPFGMREELLDQYIGETEKNLGFHSVQFRKDYYGFVLLRLLQVLGAYGFRGLFQQKAHFLKSLPLVSENIRWLMQNTQTLEGLPEIRQSLEQVIDQYPYEESDHDEGGQGLTVTIHSFSYKKGIPPDLSGNGGGFVFDCRALPNPGREEKYRAFTGQDKIVIDYLEQFEEVDHFIHSTLKIIRQSVDNYTRRGFSHLAVNFGCTGGQHRSVYCAETVAAKLRQAGGLVVKLHHTEMD